jgi:hypothetical protein
MRIVRTVSYTLRRTTTTTLKQTVLIVSSLILLVGGVFVSQNVFNQPYQAKAITPPDGCFAISGTTAITITDYYDYEFNDPANQACPRAVDIPGDIRGVPVTSIGN